MTTPPPLPEDRNPFPKVAATICLLSPLFAHGVAIGLTAFSKTMPANDGRGIIMLAGVFSVMLMVIGLILGIVSLLLMKPAQRKAVILQSAIGIALIILLAAMAVSNFSRSQKAAQGNRQAYSEFKAATSQLRDESANALTNQKGNSVSLEKFQQKLNQAATTASGEEAQLLKAGQAFTAQIISLQKDYQQSVKELSAASVLNASNLVDRAEIPQRKAIVQKFLDANDALKNFIGNGEENFRQDLTNCQVSPSEINNAIQGFNQTSRPQLKNVMQVRDADDSFGHAMLDTLDLLDQEWGHWAYNPKTERIRFEKTAALEKYNASQQQMTQARTDQAASQKQLALIMKKQAAQETPR